MPIISRTSDIYLKDKQKRVSVLQERWLSTVKKVGAEERQGRTLQPWVKRGGQGREGQGRGENVHARPDQTATLGS